MEVFVHTAFITHTLACSVTMHLAGVVSNPPVPFGIYTF